jgi:hypothetical protein
VPFYGLEALLDAPETVSADQLRDCVRTQTGRRVRDLDIACEGEYVLVTGECRSAEVKRLVTHAIRVAEPGLRVQNEIVVTG